jgi:hypothetical protein
MKAAAKIELYSQLIQHIDYDHREGGKYAYVQFLSYTREILCLLEPIPGWEEEIRLIEKINLYFNNYLCFSFGEEQRTFFHEQRVEIQLLLEKVKAQLTQPGGVSEEESWFRQAG